MLPRENQVAPCHAIVVDCIKGQKRVGEKFAFTRVSDCGTWDFVGMRGNLLYVFLHSDINGRVFVDGQDPQAIWQYSDELNRIVERYRRQR